MKLFTSRLSSTNPPFLTNPYEYCTGNYPHNLYTMFLNLWQAQFFMYEVVASAISRQAADIRRARVRDLEVKPTYLTINWRHRAALIRHRYINMTNSTEFSKRVLVAGGGGFIGSHLAKRLKEEGYYVVVADWADNIYFKNDEFCHEYHKVDLRSQDNCDLVTKDCEEIYDLAADMGGMGFILSNHSVILQNNLRIGLCLLSSAVKFGVRKFFFASSACVYPDYKQEETHITALKEDDVWPSDLRSNAYGFEKLVMEEAVRWHAHDHPNLEIRIGRFHNIYGPQGTWKGGREKAPAAFCRKVITNDEEFPMWGDGEQTRSFCLVDDCVEAVLRLMTSKCSDPINIGSDFLISMNDMAKLIMKFENKSLRIRHIDGPQGVRGRNSDNEFIKKVLGWAPETPLEDGLRRTYFWIKSQVEKDRLDGVDILKYRGSEIVKNSVEDDGDNVRGV